MGESNEYILGTEQAELERLRVQHTAWVRQAYAIFERAGLRAGQSVVDLGCGPGYTSVELAAVVGPAGRVVARDVSVRFLEFLRAESARLGTSWIEPSRGPVEELDLPDGSIDLAYARWLFCWLDDAAVALERVARSLRPGGALALQEYFDWAAMKLVPRSAAHDHAVAVCMESWRAGGATIDIGEQLPSLAVECGLQVESFVPVARVGEVGSLEWRWLGGFFANYLPKLVTQGVLEQEALDAFRGDWSARERERATLVYTPTMVDVVLRKS